MPLPYYSPTTSSPTKDLKDLKDLKYPKDLRDPKTLKPYRFTASLSTNHKCWLIAAMNP